jgi:hypothetical protein
MTTPVTYVELNSPDLEATSAFMRDVSRLGAAAVRDTGLGLHEDDLNAR